MATVFRMKDPSGNIVLDLSNRVFRFLTVQNASAAGNGSFSDDRIATGQAVAGVASAQDTKITPGINISGNTVSWDWGSTPSGDRATDAAIQLVVF